jgi:hypothetical protein
MVRCPRCGNQINDVAVWCPVCGYPLKPDEASSLSAARRNEPEVVQEYWDRPEGITLIAGLTFVSSVFLILFIIVGIPILVLTVPSGRFAPYSWILLPGILVLGVASLVDAWGLWNGKGWAWTLGVVTSSFGMATYAYQTIQSLWNIGGLVIDLWVLYYLFRPQVRGYFGKVGGPSNDKKKEAARGA